MGAYDCLFHERDHTQREAQRAAPPASNHIRQCTWHKQVRCIATLSHYSISLATLGRSRGFNEEKGEPLLNRASSSNHNANSISRSASKAAIAAGRNNSPNAFAQTWFERSPSPRFTKSGSAPILFYIFVCSLPNGTQPLHASKCP